MGFFNWGGTKTWRGGIFCTEASDLVKCVVSTAAPVLVIVNLESESETKKDHAFKSSFNAWHNSGSLMPAKHSIMYIYSGANKYLIHCRFSSFSTYKEWRDL